MIAYKQTKGGKLVCTRHFLMLLVFLCHGLSLGMNIVIWSMYTGDSERVYMMEVNGTAGYLTYDSSESTQHLVKLWIWMCVWIIGGKLIRMGMGRSRAERLIRREQKIKQRNSEWVTRVRNYHARWHHARATPRLNWKARRRRKFLRGGGKQTSGSVADKEDSPLEVLPDTSPDIVLANVRESMNLVPKEEVWKFNWPNPATWYDSLVLHWPTRAVRSTVARRDLQSTGLPWEGRRSTSMYLTDAVLNAAVGEFSSTPIEARAFLVEGKRCVLPAGLSQRWMEEHQDTDKEKAIMRWKRKTFKDDYEEIIMIVNIDRCHWMAIVIDLRTAEIKIADSGRSKSVMIKQAISTAKIVLRVIKDIPESHIETSDLRVPLQPNDHDCGICVLLYIMGLHQYNNDKKVLRNMRAWITWVMVDIVAGDAGLNNPPQLAPTGPSSGTSGAGSTLDHEATGEGSPTRHLESMVDKVSSRNFLEDGRKTTPPVRVESIGCEKKQWEEGVRGRKGTPIRVEEIDKDRKKGNQRSSNNIPESKELGLVRSYIEGTKENSTAEQSRSNVCTEENQMKSRTEGARKTELLLSKDETFHRKGKSKKPTAIASCGSLKQLTMTSFWDRKQASQTATDESEMTSRRETMKGDDFQLIPITAGVKEDIDHITHNDPESQDPVLEKMCDTEFEADWGDPIRPEGEEWLIKSLNVGPVGLQGSFRDILLLLENRPAVVFLQDVKLTSSAAARTKRRLESDAPEYVLFVNPVTRMRWRNRQKKEKIQEIRTAIIMHKGWSQRAGLYDAKNLSKGNPLVSHLENIMVLHHIDPYTRIRGLWINVYNDTAAHIEDQHATLQSVQAIVDKLEPQHEFAIVAGDWNASANARYSRYRTTSRYTGEEDVFSVQTKSADSQFQAWIRDTKLRIISDRSPTFHRVHNDMYQATLDYIFLKSNRSNDFVWKAENCDSPQPKHDHSVVNCILKGLPCSTLPTLIQMQGKTCIRRQQWEARADQWKLNLQLDSERLLSGIGQGADPLTALQEMVGIMQQKGKELLGVRKNYSSPGVFVYKQPAEEKKLRRRIRRYQVALQNLVSLSITGGQPTEALQKLRDEGCTPDTDPPKAFWMRIEPSLHKTWIDSWLKEIRQHLALVKDEYRKWEHDMTLAACDIAKTMARERMATPGSKEIKRWMGKLSAPVTTVYMKTDYPDVLDFDIKVEDETLLEACRMLGCKISTTNIDSVDKTRIDNVPATMLYQVLEQCQSLLPRLSCSDTEKVVHSDSDKLIAWEYFLSKEAQATKTRCVKCLEIALTPIVQVAGKDRSIKKWCNSCRCFGHGYIDKKDYDTPFLKTCKPEIIHHTASNTESLSRDISWEDFQYYLKKLPKRKAPGPDEITAEMIQRAPEATQRIIHAAVNKALKGDTDLPSLFKNGDIYLLFKKGDFDDPRNYRPIVLLSLIYKILTAIVTDRLNKIAEAHGLLDDSQEGFRKLRSTSRQIQSLLWDREDAEKFGRILYLVYIDFKNAFNSMDLEAIWTWLELVNVPDVPLLKNIYKDTYCQVDTPYGKTAKIYLTRGTKQGDCLSPLLFSLLFNALLTQLSRINREDQLGYLNEIGQRTLHRAFADDLSLMTGSKESMQSALSMVEAFCEWSGMQVNASKSETSGFDFQRKLALDTSAFRIGGKVLTQLRPSEPYKYLGIMCSLTGSFQHEKEYIKQITRSLQNKCKSHIYLSQQAVPVIVMLQESWFRYSAAICPWTDPEMEDLYTLWIANIKAAWKISRSTASAIFKFPESFGGKTIRQPKAVCIQALMTHIQQLTNHEDHILQHIIMDWKKLYMVEGSGKEDEIGKALNSNKRSYSCPLARLLRLCAKLKIGVILPSPIIGRRAEGPTWISVGKQLTDLSRNIQDYSKAEEPFSQEEQTFVDNWSKRTVPCRECGYADINALAKINGFWIPPSACMPPNDLDTLTKLFKRLPPSNTPQAQSWNTTEDIQEWTIPVAQEEGVVPGYLIVEHALEWILKVLQLPIEQVLNSDLRDAVVYVADKILPRPLLKRCEQVESMYYDCVQRFSINRQKLVQMFQTAKTQHNIMLSRSLSKRQRYIEHIGYRILRGLPYKPFRILSKQVQAGTVMYEVQWIYQAALPNILEFPLRYLGGEEHATWLSAAPDQKWGDDDAKREVLDKFLRGGATRKRRLIPDLPQATRVKTADAASRWTQDPLSRMITINKQNVVIPPVQKGEWSCVAKDGLATVEKSDGITKVTAFRGNQGRVTRLFLEETGDMNTWKHWEQEICLIESRKKALSLQFIYQMQEILNIEEVQGLHPMLIPQRSQSLNSQQNMLDNTKPHRKAVLHVLSRKDNTLWDAVFLCAGSTNDDQYFMVTQPDGIQSLWLTKKAVRLQTFPPGSYILQQRNSWRKTNCRTTATRCVWELWCQRGTLISDTQRLKITNIRMTKDGRVADRITLQEDLLYGPAAPLYDPHTLVIATDGSLQSDGTMGAAVTSLDASAGEAKAGVGGSPSSTLAELSALQLATEMIQTHGQGRDILVLTDSLTSLSILESNQHQDFQTIRPHDEDTSIVAKALTNALNACVRAGRSITLQKIKAHALEPLNERADELAEQAALLPPSELPGETSRCRLIINGQEPRSWSSALARAVVQIISEESLATSMDLAVQGNLVQRNERCDIITPVVKKSSKTNQWLLWKNASRQRLGQILREKKYDRNHKVITQALSNSFPTQVNLHLWKKAASPACPLACGKDETFAHLQCYCERLKAQRIAVHHKIWTTTASSIQKYLPHDKVTYVAEATIPKIMEAIESSTQPQAEKEKLQLSIANIDWEVDSPSTSEQVIAQGVQALPNIIGCAVLPSIQKRPHPTAGVGSNKKGRIQPTEQHNMLNKRDRSAVVESEASAKCSRRKVGATPSVCSQQSKNPGKQGQNMQQPTTVPKVTSQQSVVLQKRPFFPSLTKPTRARYMSIIHRADTSKQEVPAGGGQKINTGTSPSDQGPPPVPDIGRQRPDGLLIDWKKKHIHILEFTRPYDSRRSSLASTNLYKLLKYEPLHRTLSIALPPYWTTSVVAFAVGVRGTADAPSWSAALHHLRIPRRHHDQIIKATIRSSLDAIYEMTDARHAAIRNSDRKITVDIATPTVTRPRK